jgi:hypothetical protein
MRGVVAAPSVEPGVEHRRNVTIWWSEVMGGPSDYTADHGEKPALCNTIIVDFVATEPVRTMAPIRRARAGCGELPHPPRCIHEGDGRARGDEPDRG